MKHGGEAELRNTCNAKNKLRYKKNEIKKDQPTLRDQTVHSLHCKRNPQQAKSRFVAEPAALLLFFDLLCCFGFHKQIPKSLYRSKSLEK